MEIHQLIINITRLMKMNGSYINSLKKTRTNSKVSATIQDTKGTTMILCYYTIQSMSSTLFNNTP